MMLYLDCSKGIAGDMVLGALLGTGIPMNVLTDELYKLGLKDYEIQLREQEIEGISTLNVRVSMTKEHPLRHLSDIGSIIEQSSLGKDIKMQSLGIFRQLAEAEAEAHDSTIDEVHFHEIGAVDTIIDIVGAVALLRHLNPEKIAASEVNLGSGIIEFSHGRVAVPAPAVKILSRGMKTFKGRQETELATPTGMAILKCMAEQTEVKGKTISEGYGSGTRSKKYGTYLRAELLEC